MPGLVAQAQFLFQRLVALEELGGDVAGLHVMLSGLVLHQMGDGVQGRMGLAVADVQLRGHGLVLRRLHGPAHQLVDALALSGADSDHRHAQPLFQPGQINGISVAAHLVHHIEGHHHRPSQLQKLQCQIKVPLQIGGVHNVDDHVRLIPDDEIPGDDLLHGVGAEGIDARQVHDGHVAVLIRNRLALLLLPAHPPGEAHMGLSAVVMVQHGAGLLLHRYAGPVAHVLVGAGQLIEKSGLSAVLVACQSKGVLHEKISPFPFGILKRINSVSKMEVQQCLLHLHFFSKLLL